MRFYRPHSFFTLLLTGFVFVALPLLTALFSSVQIMDGLVRQSALAVYSSVDRTSNVRRLADLLRDQERKARLFRVLGEPAQLEAVNQVHRDLQEVFDHLLGGDHDPVLTSLLARLQARENHIVAVLNNLSGGPEWRKQVVTDVLDLYQGVDILATDLAAASNKIMRDGIRALREKVSQGKKTLAWQTSGLIGFSILFVIVFVFLISKPIRQIDRGIEYLGNGDFATPIKISGPRDLEALGQRLDWLRRRLAELDREKIRMIAHISHELKTPLASIREGAGLLRDELVGPMNSRQKDVVAILDKNSEKLQKLIEDILDFNMSQARRAPVGKEPVDLAGLLRTVAADHNNTILARRISLELDLDDLVIPGDPKQLRTVIDNLLSNAVKFTPDGGRIRLRLSREDDRAVILVQDSGAGVDREDRSRIFSPFFQGKEAKKAVVKGSGLGLAIAREYVQNHDGEITLLPGGQGACFCVRLPLENREVS